MDDLPPVGGFLASADFYDAYQIPDGYRPLAYYRMTDGTRWRIGHDRDRGWGWVRVE